MDITVYNSYASFVKITAKRLHYTDWKVNLTEAVLKEATLPFCHDRRNQLVVASPMSYKPPSGLILLATSWQSQAESINTLFA